MKFPKNFDDWLFLLTCLTMLLFNESLAAKRENVVIFGTTLGPNFVRREGKGMIELQSELLYNS